MKFDRRHLGALILPLLLTFLPLWLLQREAERENRRVVAEGDTVNLASRLCDLASNLDNGAVLVEHNLVQGFVGDVDPIRQLQKLRL